jgi:hypothetical protein
MELFVGVNSTYSSIYDAVNNATENSTIYVEGGDYYESIFVNKSGIRIVANQSETVNLFTSNSGWFGSPSPGSYGLHVESDYFEVHNIQFHLQYDGNMGIFTRYSNITFVTACLFNISGDRSAGIYGRESSKIFNSNCEFIINGSQQGFGIYSDFMATKVETMNGTFTINGNSCFGISTDCQLDISKCSFEIMGTNSGGFAFIGGDSNKVSEVEMGIFSSNVDSSNIGIFMTSSSMNFLHDLDIISIDPGATFVKLINSNAIFKNLTFIDSNFKMVSDTINSYLELVNITLLESSFQVSAKGIDSRVDWKGDIDPDANIVNLGNFGFYYYRMISIRFFDEFNNSMSGIHLLLTNQLQTEYKTSMYLGHDPVTNSEGETENRFYLISSKIDGNNRAYQLNVKYFHPGLKENRSTQLTFNDSSSHLITVNLYPPCTPVNVKMNH